MTTVGQALVAGLHARGVQVVFGIPGVHTIELYRGLPGSGIRHVTARHEQGAAFMADGYARVSGKPGVAFVITGPGLTNALTAMAQARADSVPMLVISGVNRRSSQGHNLGLLHELPDQTAMVAALCPSFQVTNAETLDRTLSRAFAALNSDRPGPVHLQVPTDVMALASADLRPPAAPPAPAQADSAAIKRAAARLAQAKRPLILAGGGTRHVGAALQALAERLDAPVVQTVNARGLMHGHPLTVAASPSLDAVRALIAAADQVLAIGTELGPTDYDMYVRGGLPELSGMIRIDLCADQLARHPAAMTLQADAGAAMAALLAVLAPRQSDGPARAEAARTAARAELPPALQQQLTMLEAMRAALPRSIIVGDSTQPIYAGNLFYDHDRPGGWFNAATGYGALGYGPGAAVGAALAAPGSEIICLIGDGGLQFSPGELRTAVDEGLPISFVVWNNAGFREIAEAMTAAGVPVTGCTPSPLNLEPFAAACDLPFTSIPNKPAALRKALATRHAGPRLIEIRVP
ncbi:5-guanidino-2-oxopentanoate decarboxylase [Rhodobacter ferrooxidans]|uniref:Thiamine pyrophosphate protein TPP binding domain protein n=1 Tax=Rhodobacter ferrooxidans TaxID=371731 RepID=C8RZY8_9RHOB|nr:5-guanidino-2-oxopentanoate decarboxylase [Rhodobacter sp. SW2]EEW25597.1 thiamine pyrophosphate protein TPP binding domain protein [Rhodobacter sp. SW2]